MLVEEELGRISPEKGMWLTIGVFDGVHLGHQHLISQLVQRARQHNCLSGVLTFQQHPEEVLLPSTRLPCITVLAEKVRLLKAEGVDHVIVLSFTRELTELSPRQFTGLLQKYLRMQGLVIGPDFALGKDRQGNAGVLRELGQEMSFDVVVVKPVLFGGGAVSSTAIRDALVKGDMERVRRMTGRYFGVSARVTTGEHRGARLGFPTANLEVDPEQTLPADGVYATLAHIGGQSYQAVTNIGKRPTFGAGQRTVEVYILSYSGDLYGQELRIDIVRRLRAEKRFDTPEELQRQIAEDIERGAAMLKGRG